MNERNKKILFGLGYSAWFSLCFVALTLLTFPWSRVRDNVTVVAANSNLAVTMDSLGPAWVGARAKNLSIGELAKGDAAPPWITFERLKAKTGLFAVLRTGRAVGTVAASGGKPPGEFTRILVDSLGTAAVDAEMYGGELALDLSQAGENAAQFDLNIRDVDLTTFEVSNPKFSMNPRGTVRGKSDVTWNWEDPKKSKGSVDLTVDDLVVSGLKAGAFGLPEMLFSRSEAHLKIARGKAEVNDTVFEADEVQAVVEGHISLTKSLMRSRLALKLRFKLRDDLDSLAKVAFGSNPRHKDGDGWYHYQVNGTLAKPRFREAAAAASTQGRGGAARRNTNRRPRDLDAGDERPNVSRRRNPAAGDRVQRKKLHELEDPEEIEAERERLRGEREKRREELLAKRRERQERLRSERESGDSGHRQVEFDDRDFERTNEPDEEVIIEDESEEEFIEEDLPDEEFIEEGEFDPVPEGEFDDGEYIEE